MNDVPRRIDILAFPDVQLLDVAGPLQVFASANELSLAAGASAPYAPRVIAIVAGGRGVHAASKDAAQVAWLRERASQCRRVASVCTGAFMLAAAGLLDER